jgi:uncharacterized membrane protein YccC
MNADDLARLLDQVAAADRACQQSRSKLAQLPRLMRASSGLLDQAEAKLDEVRRLLRAIDRRLQLAGEAADARRGRGVPAGPERPGVPATGSAGTRRAPPGRMPDNRVPRPVDRSS